MNGIERFREALVTATQDKMKSKLQAQIEWAEVKSVSADGTMCDVQMLTDKEGVITEGISTLFSANMGMKPKTGSKCLVAHIMNDDSEGLLVWCEEIQEITINGDALGGIPIAGKIAERLARVENVLMTLSASIDSHTHLILAPIPGTPTATPLPVITPVLTPMLQPLSVAAYFENNKVKHGQG